MLSVVVLLGCATQQSHPTDPTPLPAPLAEPRRPAPIRPTPTVTPIAAPTPVIATLFGDGIRAVRFLKNTVVLKEPRSDAGKVGIVRKGTLADVRRAAPAGDGCTARWIEIAPRGWTCELLIVPSGDEPTQATAVSLTDPEDGGPGPVVPGVYGIVRGNDVVAFETRSGVVAGEGRVLDGAHSVRATGVVTVDGRRYWRTSQGDLIDASSIIQISPSKFRGVAVDTTALPAWVRTRGNPRKPAITRAAPTPRGKVIGVVAARSVVTIVEQSEDGRYVRVNDTEWVARADLRVASLAEPPPGAGPDEKWFDIDLDEQILVAYEGTRPVYATLVSTGKWRHETPATITRIASKLERAHMISEKEERYSVADVPWTMYYDHNFALHTSYWHDGFGGPRSHGCINLAPRDARLLYRWSSPDVPPGWIAVYGDEDNPGSLVRVRSRRVPEPPFRGYARTLHERGVVISSVLPSG